MKKLPLLIAAVLVMAAPSVFPDSYNPGGGGGGTGDAQTSGTLAQFAPTTSAQLAGVLTNESGSGLVVFSTSPTITSGTFSGTQTFGAIGTSDGALLLYNGSNNNSFSINAGAPSGDLTLNPPGTTGTKTFAIQEAQTFTGMETFSKTGAASTNAVLVTGVPFAGTGTTSFPQVYIADAAATASTTLSTAGTSFGVNAHTGIGNLADLLLDGTSKFKVTSAGAGTFASGLTAATINGNTFTTGTGTLTLGAGKVATISNTLTLTATDGSTLAIGTGGTLGTAAYTASTAYQAVDSDLTSWAAITRASGYDTFATTASSANLAALLSDETGSGVAVFGTSPAITTSVTTPSTTFALLNTTATTINAFGAATTVNTGASATQIWNFGGSTTASEFRFLEPSGSGTNYSAFKAVAQSANITYSLPPAVGAAGTVLRDAAGNGVLDWAAVTATPAGSNTYIQYNASGSLGAEAAFNYDASTNTLVADNITASGTITAGTLNPTSIAPTSNDGAALGDATHAWSDMFLAEGGVINWDNGDATMTQTANDITFAGISTFGIGTSTTFTTGDIELGAASDTTIHRSGAGDATIEGNQIYRAGGTDVAMIDGGTGASLTDPNADRVLFWDDSAGAMAWLTMGNNLTITGTTLDATGGSGGTAGAPLFVQTATATAVTGNSETTILGTGAGSLTIPTTWFTAAGTVMDVRFSGKYSTGLTPGTLQLKLKFGSTVVGQTAAFTPIVSVTDGVYSGFVRLVARTVGASGTIFVADGLLQEGTTLTPGLSKFSNPTLGTAVTIDTTATQVVDLTATWSTAATNSITGYTFEMVGPGSAVSSVFGATGAVTTANITGSRTFGAGSTDTIVWTMDRATGTDSTITSLSGGIGVQSLTNAALTSGRVTFAGASGILADDADFTFATDTATITKIVGSTSITNSSLTSGRIVFSGTAGIESDDSDLSFATDTLTATKIAATTFTGAETFTPTARSSGTAAYITVNIPADTGITAATESIGVNHVTGARTWADGTVTLQRENFWAGPTYNKTTTSATFTDAFTGYMTPPIAGTGVTFTRGHTLGIVDSTSAASSITGGLVVSTTVGTTATSVGIGGGNVNAGGTGTFGGALTSGGVSVPTISSTETLTNKRVTARITSISSSGTPTVNTDNCDCVTITAQAAALTSMTTNLSGTPVNFDQLEFRIKDDGTARAITWGASFVAGPTALPTTTVISKALHVWFEYDSVQAKWVCMSSGSDA